MDPKRKTNNRATEYEINQEQTSLTTECASWLVSTYMFY